MSAGEFARVLRPLQAALLGIVHRAGQFLSVLAGELGIVDELGGKGPDRAVEFRVGEFCGRRAHGRFQVQELAEARVRSHREWEWLSRMAPG